MKSVVLYPSPGIGHLISMVELGKLLLSHNSSLSITILMPAIPLITGSSFSYISSISSDFPSISFHSLPVVPLQLKELSRYPNFEQVVFEILKTSNPYVHQLLQSLSIASPVSAFILDFFCYPALETAQSFNIPAYFFYTSGVSALAYFLNFSIFDNIATDSFRNLGETLFEIPGLFAVSASQMMKPMLDRGESYDEFVRMSAHLPKADGIIVNTFESLEPRAVEALKQGTCLPGKIVPPVYCIGPLIANRGEVGKDEKGGEKNECLSWLDLQPSCSVVYLSFGSMGLFGEKQIKEIAVGLERSGVRFLWVVRAPLSEDKAKRFVAPAEPDLETLLPQGFLDRTKGRGFVVKTWAPQIAILAHEAVGGFVTHCGWNSTLEAVNAGVPMVAWPLYAEQRFNKILLVEEIKVALPMDELNDRFVKSDEVERRVKQIINSEEGNSIRRRLLNLSNESKDAFGEGGSSKMSFFRLVKSLDK